MKVLIFDMDGVLVDMMPFHYVALKMAIKEVAYIDLDKRAYYLLVGMPVAEMALEIFKIMGRIDTTNIAKQDIQTSENVAKRKEEIFKETNVAPRAFDGVRKLIIRALSGGSKAVVSGAAKEEVDTTIRSNIWKRHI